MRQKISELSKLLILNGISQFSKDFAAQRKAMQSDLEHLNSLITAYNEKQDKTNFDAIKSKINAIDRQYTDLFKQFDTSCHKMFPKLSNEITETERTGYLKNFEEQIKKIKTTHQNLNNAIIDDFSNKVKKQIIDATPIKLNTYINTPLTELNIYQSILTRHIQDKFPNSPIITANLLAQKLMPLQPENYLNIFESEDSLKNEITKISQEILSEKIQKQYPNSLIITPNILSHTLNSLKPEDYTTIFKNEYNLEKKIKDCYQEIASNPQNYQQDLSKKIQEIYSKSPIITANLLDNKLKSLPIEKLKIIFQNSHNLNNEIIKISQEILASKIQEKFPNSPIITKNLLEQKLLPLNLNNCSHIFQSEDNLNKEITKISREILSKKIQDTYPNSPVITADTLDKTLTDLKLEDYSETFKNDHNLQLKIIEVSEKILSKKIQDKFPNSQINQENTCENKNIEYYAKIFNKDAWEKKVLQMYSDAESAKIMSNPNNNVTTVFKEKLQTQKNQFEQFEIEKNKDSLGCFGIGKNENTRNK